MCQLKVVILEHYWFVGDRNGFSLFLQDAAQTMAAASTSVALIGEASAADAGMASGSTKIEERVVT